MRRKRTTLPIAHKNNTHLGENVLEHSVRPCSSDGARLEVIHVVFVGQLLRHFRGHFAGIAAIVVNLVPHQHLQHDIVFLNFPDPLFQVVKRRLVVHVNCGYTGQKKEAPGARAA